jgi:hypothetical protein
MLGGGWVSAFPAQGTGCRVRIPRRSRLKRMFWRAQLLRLFWDDWGKVVPGLWTGATLEWVAIAVLWIWFWRGGGGVVHLHPPVRADLQ